MLHVTLGPCGYVHDGLRQKWIPVVAMKLMCVMLSDGVVAY
jgi:hypothetical protein